MSAIAFCLLVVAWFAAGAVDPREQRLSLSDGCHLSISDRRGGPRVHVFNDARYGPYSGSIVGIVRGPGDPNGPQISGVGDVAGVYYRMIRWSSGASLWTVSLSLIYPLLLAAALPLAWLVRRSRGSRRGFPVERTVTAG